MKDSESWIAEEFSSSDFGDERLNARFLKIAKNCANNPQAPLNQACDGWGDTKACYRFFDNEKVSSDGILKSHFENTVKRAQQYPFVLVVQDTTSFDYSRQQKTKNLGNIGGQDAVKFRTHGLMMHASYALSPEGLPLGLISEFHWSRSWEKIKSDHYNDRLYSSEEKETYKWIAALEQSISLLSGKVPMISIADRECDIIDFYLAVKDTDSHFIVRAHHDRNIGDRYEFTKLFDLVKGKAPLDGKLSIQIPIKPIKNEDKRKRSSYHESAVFREAEAEIRCANVVISPSRKVGQILQEKVALTIIEVREKNPPENCKDLHWFLLTSLNVSTFEDAALIAKFYSLRWKIETFFKTLKSGCQIEKCRLGDGDKLKKYISLYSIIAWRIHLLTLFGRTYPDEPCSIVLTSLEWKTLYKKINSSTEVPSVCPSANEAIIWIARLGGYLNRSGDGPPGITAIWRGWTRLQDMVSIQEICE